MERTRGGPGEVEREGLEGGVRELSCPACAQPVEAPFCGQCGAVVRVGPYRILRVLSHDGRGRTYLAQGPEGRMVLRERCFSAEPSPADLRGMQLELQRLQALAHPCVPRYLEVLLSGSGADTRAYRVQEYIEGTSLEEDFACGRLTETEAQGLAVQVLGLLRYLQERTPPLVHGDLKPSNLIRRADGALFLVDFGMGSGPMLPPGRAPSPYRPPEQGSGRADATTDLFALGVLLKQGLTGAAPGSPSPPPAVSPPFARLLERLSAPDRRARFSSAYEAMRALEPSVLPPRRRTPLLKVALLGTGVCLTALGVGLFLKKLSPLSGFRPGVDVSALAAPGPQSMAPGPPVRHGSPPSSRARRQPTLPTRSMGFAYDQGQKPGSMKIPLQGMETLEPQHTPKRCEWAQRGTATSSIHVPGQEPKAVLDHDPDTAWHSTAQPTWLRVDLPKEVELNALVLTWAVTGPGRTSAEGILETSLDGRTWEPMFAVTNTAAENDVPHLIQFARRPIQSVRFKVRLSGSDLLSVRSLELYGSGCSLRGPDLAP
ncbi:Serine/threonine protein kinase [Stigmatella aurantiaca]|uniref:non-specific serine/threonine protein kinase n=1 Tax=Stigmatella aurantiaca TaxID=41 RepID=A0A1H7M312_STIAU|nr:discoidin domain-containing protein [Stigmatella aurantiaca]SEL05479.1 Serine/threonine protein kinase [Stigmatella aurantiaca]